MKFKKLFLLTAAVLSLCMVAGCGGNDKKAANAGKAQAAGLQPAGNSHILIAYFTYSGNTERLAKMLQQETGADLFKVETAEPYSQSYHACVTRAKREKDNNERPALQVAKIEKMSSYDTVFIAYPNWCNSMPMAMNTFLESNDMSGKKIVAFATSGGGGFGTGLADLPKLAPQSTVEEGLHIPGSQVEDSGAVVAQWCQEKGYKK